jgi:ABC-2 type transport system permease protein
MRPPPGSFLWLLAHDVRLNWRRFAELLGNAGALSLTTLFVAGTIILHLIAWPAFLWLAPLVHGNEATTTPIAIALFCIFTWMIAQGLFGTTRTLYDRGDLDLLLGAPLPAARILGAKAVSIAASTLGSIALLVLPLANVGALLGHPRWLAAYPVLVSLSLIATALGLGLSIGLFFLMGPRRARLYTQMTGAAIAGAFVLGAQVVAILPEALRVTVTNWLAAAGGPETPIGRLLILPIDAMRGDTRALLMLAGFAALLFSLAVKVLARHFAVAVLAASGAPSGRLPRRTADDRPIRFRSGLARNLRRKEWRLLARDPSMFAQLGLQIIYTIPIAVVLLRSEALPTALALAPTIVVIAAQVAASLSWIMVSGEDAPELMATAPVAPADVDCAKLTAVALPVLVIIGLPLIGLALVSWRIALLTTLFAAAGAASTSLLNFWHPMPGNRRGMLRRHQQSKLIALVEHALAILWAIAIVLTLIASPVAVIPVALVVAILGFFRNRHQRSSIGAAASSKPPLTPAPAAPASV